MRQFIVLLSAVSIALAAPGNFTFHPTIGGRIVGGDEADISDYPYQVALLRNGAQICGGAIIGPDTVLTAAHCVEPSVISNIDQLNVRVGSSQWRSGGQRIAAREIIYHELYRNLDYDIAVVKLAERIHVANAVAIEMADVEFNAGEVGVVSGWGVTSSGAWVSPETLRKVEVPIVTPATCRQAYGSSSITERMVCAGYTVGGKDACQGDSGGPFAVRGQLAGIVSWGYGCAVPLYPGVYANVANLRRWIRENSGI